jgi:hypothetical protein
MRLLVTAVLIFSSTFIYSQSFEVGSFFSNSQKNTKIEGVVLDNEANNGPLAFASISVKNLGIEATTNIDGSFVLNLKPGTYTLLYSFIGYKTIEVENVVVSANNKELQNQTMQALQIESGISIASLY